MVTSVNQTFSEIDAIKTAIQQGRQQIIFVENFPVSHISPYYTLDEFVLMVNQDNLLPCGREIFMNQTDAKPTVDPAQIVKINRLYHSIQNQKIVKPMLLDFQGGKFRPNTGDSRMRALSLLPHIRYTPAFVTFNSDHTIPFSGVKITDFDTFAKATGVPNNTNFWFTLDDNNKIIWYEVDLHTDIPCAGQQFADWCRSRFADYIKTQDDDFLISRQWFTEEINWDQYVLE